MVRTTSKTEKAKRKGGGGTGRHRHVKTSSLKPQQRVCLTSKEILVADIVSRFVRRIGPLKLAVLYLSTCVTSARTSHRIRALRMHVSLRVHCIKWWLSGTIRVSDEKYVASRTLASLPPSRSLSYWQACGWRASANKSLSNCSVKKRSVLARRRWRPTKGPELKPHRGVVYFIVGAGLRAFAHCHWLCLLIFTASVTHAAYEEEHWRLLRADNVGVARFCSWDIRSRVTSAFFVRRPRYVVVIAWRRCRFFDAKGWYVGSHGRRLVGYLEELFYRWKTVGTFAACRVTKLSRGDLSYRK